MSDARDVAKEIVSKANFMLTERFRKRDGVGCVIYVSDFDGVVYSPAFASVMAEEGFYWESRIDEAIVVNLLANMNDEDN